MSTAESLLEQASSVLAKGNVHSNRAACWIARAALESAVDDLLANRSREAPTATMRSKLTVLEVAFEKEDASVPTLAEYAWSGLSRASHHHAFELTPPFSEVQHLIGLVRQLADTAANRTGTAPSLSTESGATRRPKR
jgi:hypothetical protein